MAIAMMTIAISITKIVMGFMVLRYKNIDSMDFRFESHNGQLACPRYDRGFKAILVHGYRQIG